MQGNSGETDTEQTYGRGERGGDREIHGENTMETYTTICKRESVGICSLSQGTQQGLCISLEGGVGDGKEVQEGGDICIPMTNSR